MAPQSRRAPSLKVMMGTWSKGQIWVQSVERAASGLGSQLGRTNHCYLP